MTNKDKEIENIFDEDSADENLFTEQLEEDKKKRNQKRVQQEENFFDRE